MINVMKKGLKYFNPFFFRQLFLLSKTIIIHPLKHESDWQ